MQRPIAAFRRMCRPQEALLQVEYQAEQLMEAQSATTDRDAEFDRLEGALTSERAAVTRLKERLQKAGAVEEQLQMQVLAAWHLHRASVWLLHIWCPRNRQHTLCVSVAFPSCGAACMSGWSVSHVRLSVSAQHSRSSWWRH